jgi:drug/metabolite transporter (DMT)-like permease
LFASCGPQRLAHVHRIATMSEVATTTMPTSASAAQKHARAWIALILGGLVIGLSPILVRLSPVGPVATAFWRVSLACFPLLFVFGYNSRNGNAGRLPKSFNEHIVAAIPGVFLALDLAAWHVSLGMTSVANAALLANMAPIFVTLAAWLIWRQAVSRVFLVGLGISIVGIIVLRGGPAAIGGGNLRGDAIALLAAAFYGGYILLAARSRQVFPVPVVMIWSTVTAAVCTLPLAMIFESKLFPSTIKGLLVLLALAWIAHAAGHSLITFSLAWLPASFSSLTLLIQPVVAGILAWVLLGEPLGSWQIAGGLTIISGIALAKRG